MVNRGGLWRNLFAGVVKFTGDCEKAGGGRKKYAASRGHRVSVSTFVCGD